MKLEEVTRILRGTHGVCLNRHIKSNATDTFPTFSLQGITSCYKKTIIQTLHGLVKINLCFYQLLIGNAINV